jgi:importin subunit alpha-6/7
MKFSFFIINSSSLRKKTPGNKTIKENAIWLYSNLCLGKPCVAFNKVEPGLSVLKTILDEEKDLNIIETTLSVVSYLSDGPDENIQKVIDAGLVPSVFYYLESKPTTNSIKKAALRSIGNIITGNDEQTQLVMDLNVLKYLKISIKSTINEMKKETLWMISNITAGSNDQIQVNLVE